MEIMKLNIITASLLGSSSLVHIASQIFENDKLVKVRIALEVVYGISNPFVYMLSMRELKTEYKRLLCRQRMTTDSNLSV